MLISSPEVSPEVVQPVKSPVSKPPFWTRLAVLCDSPRRVIMTLNARTRNRILDRSESKTSFQLESPAELHNKVRGPTLDKNLTLCFMLRIASEYTIPLILKIHGCHQPGGFSKYFSL